MSIRFKFVIPESQNQEAPNSHLRENDESLIRYFTHDTTIVLLDYSRMGNSLIILKSINTNWLNKLFAYLWMSRTSHSCRVSMSHGFFLEKEEVYIVNNIWLLSCCVDMKTQREEIISDLKSRSIERHAVLKFQMYMLRWWSFAMLCFRLFSCPWHRQKNLR